MKSLWNPRTQPKSFAAILFVLFGMFAFAVALLPMKAHAQQAQLSLADILIGLRSNKVTLIERNKLLSGAVEVRGITFSLTPEIEKELESTGADLVLIASIKQKSVFTKSSATLQQKLTPPVFAPVPVPVEPDSAFYQKLADENVSKGDNDAALVNYSKSIELAPENSALYLSRAMVFLKNKNYQSALADYDKAIELKPSEPIALTNRAYTFEKLGKTENALSDYKKVIDIDEKNETALNSIKRIEDERARQLQIQKEAEQARAQNELAKETPKAEEPKVVPVLEQSEDQTVDLGRLSASMATNLVAPTYSQTAKSLYLTGQVTVEVEIDESGDVTSTKSKDGHRLLRESAEQAAKRSKFKPVIVDGKAMKSKGFIVYNFVR